MSKIVVTGRERLLGSHEFIVSKTDLAGRITYANDVFQRLAGYTERELLGQPHNIVRHPDMPAAVFRLLWDEIQAGREVFAYVKNLCKNGDHYWVLAHVTPSRDGSGRAFGYHSHRRKPDAHILQQVIEPLYAKLLATEQRVGSRKAGSVVALEELMKTVANTGMFYTEFIYSLGGTGE